jgi:hypothetical protein
MPLGRSCKRCGGLGNLNFARGDMAAVANSSGSVVRIEGVSSA